MDKPVDNPTPKQEEPVEENVEKVEEQNPNQEVVNDETPKETPKEEVKETPKEEKIERTQLEKVRDLVTDAGLQVEDVVHVLNDNQGKLDADTLLKLNEKYGESVGSLIAEQLKGVYDKQVEANQAKDKAVYDQVAEAFKDVTDQSGEDTWKELNTWAKENISNEDRKELNGLLKQGGLAAKLVVQELATAFKESNGMAYQEADLIEGDNVADIDNSGLDKGGYTRELNKLLAEGHDYHTSPDIRKLQRRRQKSLSRGL